MKHLYLLTILVFPSLSAFAQEEQTIQQWQSAHPFTQFISTERYSTFSEAEKTLLGTDYILFNGEITMLQLLAASPADQPLSLANPEEAQFIKDWLAEHLEIWIIPQSQYVRANDEERNEFEQVSALILASETVTWNDIINYH